MISATPVRLSPTSAKLPEAENRKPETESLFHTVARVLLIAILMAAPLALGAVQSWAWGTMTGIVGCVLLLWAGGCVHIGAIEVMWSPFYIPALALLIMALVQLRFGLTLDRVGTREAILKLVTYLAIFFLTQQLFARRSERVWRMVAGAVALYAFVMALFAIIQFFASPGLLYGVIKPRWGGSVFGPYVNHADYAGLMEMLIPLVVAFAISLPQRHPVKPFLLFAVFISLVSVLLSGSRGGLLAFLLELGIFIVVVLFATGRHSGLVVVGLGIAVLAISFSLWLDSGSVSKRWKEMAYAPELALGERNRIAIDSLRMSRDHFAYGVGIGAFEVAYPEYQTVITDSLIDYAHNDYAQLFAETGIMGWVLVPVSIAAFIALSFRRLQSQLNQQIRWLQMGAVVAVCGILIHSLSDFNLHIPANAAWFAACSGLALVSTTSNRKCRPRL